MYSTILIPLDGSKRAEAILPHVEDLAGRYGATVVFMQVVDPVPFTVGYEPSYVVLREDLERRTQEAESYLAGLSAFDPDAWTLKFFAADGTQDFVTGMPSPVPLPAAGWLLAGAVGALAFGRKRST